MAQGLDTLPLPLYFISESQRLLSGVEATKIYPSQLLPISATLNLQYFPVNQRR